MREALEQRVWSVMTRGLRDYLIRVAEDDGALIRDSPVAALVMALGAHAEEAPLVRAAVELLLGDGFLTGSPRSLFVDRLPEAQSWERPTPAAATSAETDTRTVQTTTTVSTERVRRFRERQREAASANRVEAVAPGETLARVSPSVSSARETVSPGVSCNVPRRVSASRGDRNAKHSGNFLDLQKQKQLDLLPPETRAAPVSTNGPASVSPVSVSPVSVSPARRTKEEENDDDNLKARGEEREGDDITARAKRLKSNPDLAATLRPERWPEVLSVAQAFASAAGIPKQPLGQYDNDAGVKALVTLYAAGFTQFQLEHVARTVPEPTVVVG